MKLSEIIARITHSRIISDLYKNNARVNARDLTRKRKMPFEELILYMLQSLKCSTQSAFRRFFTQLAKPVTMKQQSLSEARQKLTAWAFWDLFMVTCKTMTEHCAKKWHNYRVYAIDGSKIALPSDKELAEHFGALGKDGTAPTAQGSILYDVLNDIVADAAIEPMSICERTLALSHLEVFDDIAQDDKKLIIFDRGYPSFELIDELETNSLFYVMRVKKKFNLDIDAQTSTSGYVWLFQNGKRIHVRVIKFKLDSGETETLITNIEDARLGKNAFKKLYFMRWPVETKYDIVKNKLQLENFSTRTVEGIQQDFFAHMYLANFAASCAIDVYEEITEVRNAKENKYQYKANMNELIGILKDRLVLVLVEDCPIKQSALIHVILDEIKGCVIPIRPERSTPRDSVPRNIKFHPNKKSNC